MKWNYSKFISQLMIAMLSLYPISILFQQDFYGLLNIPKFYEQNLKLLYNTTTFITLLPYLILLIFSICCIYLFLSRNIQRWHLYSIFVVIVFAFMSNYFWYTFNIFEILTNEKQYDNLVDDIHFDTVEGGITMSNFPNDENRIYFTYRDPLSNSIWLVVPYRHTFMLQIFGDYNEINEVTRATHFAANCSLEIRSWHFCYLDYYKSDTFFSLFRVCLEYTTKEPSEFLAQCNIQ